MAIKGGQFLSKSMLAHGATSFKEFECVMEGQSWIPNHIIQLYNSCITWNVPVSLT